MREMPRAFELYKHFKGNLYQVIAIATDSEDGSRKVVYQALYGDYKIYVRDLQSFMSLTDKEKYPNAEQRYRFELVSRDDKKTEMDLPKKTQNLQAEEKNNDKKAADSIAYEEKTGEDPRESGLDPAVEAYLDANGYEERLNILTSVHHRITDEMLTTMSLVSDIELAEGSVEEKYQSLKNCLLTKQKFEILARN